MTEINEAVRAELWDRVDTLSNKIRYAHQEALNARVALAEAEADRDRFSNLRDAYKDLLTD